MKLTPAIKMSTLALCSWLTVAPAIAAGEDIDIFTGASGGTAVNPRVLVILDNSANWSRNNEGWQPKGTNQGESELRALKSVVSRMTDKISFGLMEFGTLGQTDTGFIRRALLPVTDDYKANLTTLFSSIDPNSSTEKASMSVGYGEIMRSAHNYFAGGNALDTVRVDTNLADRAGYSTFHTKFKSPVDANNLCGKSFIVFIGNTANGGPKSDEETNRTALKLLTSDHSELALPNSKSVAGDPVKETAAITRVCYASKTLALAGALLEPSVASACEYYDSCAVGDAVATTTPTCALGTSAYNVVGTSTVETNVELPGALPSNNRLFMADEWARMMAEKGVLVEGSTVREAVATYTVDVHKNHPDPYFTGLMLNMAKYGKGKYFKATTEQALVDALEAIMAEIQATNSAFASTSLPVNATNRSQNENQIFIGMFRPDGNRRPRWFGNLKRYQLIKQGDNLELGDEKGALAVSTSTGFMTPCARSFWSDDSGNYWNLSGTGDDVEGTCNTDTKYNDLPDGDLVEKGAAAQMLRQGNDGSAAGTRTLNRNIKTLVFNGAGKASFGNFDTTNVPSTTLASQVVHFIRGADVHDEKGGGASNTLTRPSIHGDVIHSRPLPVNYGATKGITVYYGSNDGTLHAVDAATGREHWSFVAPEFFPRLSRLNNNFPLVKYPGESTAMAAVTTRKDYFFDGSIGIYQNADSSEAYIFPSMRRGGRTVYGIDASSPTAPAFLWRKGCRSSDLRDTDSCDSGFSDIGQTWSTPIPAFVKGYSETSSTAAAKPLVVFGGGYDTCEDANEKITTGCDSAKGNKVYIVDAKSGELIKAFDTTRPVVADVSMVDIDSDGYVDYGYAADTGGNMYRISFISNPSTTRTALDRDGWTIRKIGKMDGESGRKFLFAPSLLYTANKVYLAIGSGDREHPLNTHYPFVDSVQNRFYVYKDDLTVTTGEAQDFDSLTDYSAPTNCDTPGATPSSTLSGWFMNLEKGRGEQVVTSSLIVGGMVAFSTNQATVAAAGTCRTALGKAHGYWLNLFNAAGAIGKDGTCSGARSSEYISGGLPPSPVLATSVPIETKDKDGKVIETTYHSAIFGASNKSGKGANTPFNPQPIPPAIDRKRKRTYSYSNAD